MFFQLISLDPLSKTFDNDESCVIDTQGMQKSATQLLLARDATTITMAEADESFKNASALPDDTQLILLEAGVLVRDGLKGRFEPDLLAARELDITGLGKANLVGIEY